MVDFSVQCIRDFEVFVTCICKSRCAVVVVTEWSGGSSHCRMSLIGSNYDSGHIICLKVLSYFT